MDSWVARDPVEDGSKSSGRDTSDCGAFGVLIFLRLLYPDSCSKCFYLILVACRVAVFQPAAFSDSWDCVFGSHRVSVKGCNCLLVARTTNRLWLRPPDQ